MSRFSAVLLAACGLLTSAAPAQVTNVLPTKLEAFEAQTGTIIIKGTGEIGSVAVGALTITVSSKESMDVGTGRKEYGMAIEVAANSQQVWKKVVDYEEMASLVNSLNYLSRINYNVTTLPTFVAGHATASGFRVGAFTSQRRSSIQFFLEDHSVNGERILITPDQLARFQLLIEQTKKNLDLLRVPN